MKEDLFQYHQQSTVPIVRFEKNKKESESGSEDSSEDDDDENLFLEFDSDEDQEGKDHEMASTTTAQSKKPLIMELDSKEFASEKTAAMKQANKKRRPQMSMI